MGVGSWRRFFPCEGTSVRDTPGRPPPPAGATGALVHQAVHVWWVSLPLTAPAGRRTPLPGASVVLLCYSSKKSAPASLRRSGSPGNGCWPGRVTGKLQRGEAGHAGFRAGDLRHGQEAEGLQKLQGPFCTRGAWRAGGWGGPGLLKSPAPQPGLSQRSPRLSPSARRQSPAHADG